jgi:uncharacterized NAD(P)/FAD-binding protein YdhS
MELTWPVNSIICIIGAGASGTLAASQLLDAANRTGRRVLIHLVDPRSATGQGVAYSTHDERHLLNVPTRSMSAYPDDPDHFLRWLELDAGEPMDACGFVPRPVYARYLAEVLADAAARSPDGRLNRVRRRAVSVHQARTQCTVVLDDGTAITADACVLATGHFGDGASWAPPALRSSARLVIDPWAPGALEEVPERGDVLVVGAGLTMADVVRSLDRPGRVVHVTSRSGKHPHVHVPGNAPRMEAPELPEHPTLAQLRAAMQAHVAKAKGRYGDWRPAIDSIRAITPTLWGGLTDDDRAEFLRTDRRSWDHARHRLPPVSAAALDRQRGAGRLVDHRGAVIDATVDGDTVAITLGDGTRLDVVAVVNCTGPGESPVSSSDPLVRALVDGGLARPGPLDLGLDTRSDGRVVALDGTADGLLWAIGPLRRGTLWETTAVPEIRAQAAGLAEQLLGRDRPRARRPADRYDLPLSTTTEAAEHYVRAQDALLLMHDDALEHLELAVNADPGFAVAHATLALLGYEWTLPIDVPRRIEAARNSVRHRGDDRERSLVRAIDARLCGSSEADELLRDHVVHHPRDAFAVGVAIPTIAFGGLTQPAEESWALAEQLAPAYGDDWWFGGVLAFVRQEQGRWAEAEHLAARSLDLEARSGHAAHARTHVCYETGEHTAGLRWLDTWIDQHAPMSRYRSHYCWHAALHELALDDMAALRVRWRSQLAPPAVMGARALVDSASMLWRAKLAGLWPREQDVAAQMDSIFEAVPECLLDRPATAFAAMNAALAHAARDDAHALRALAAHARCSSEPTFVDVVAPLCDAFAMYVSGQSTKAASELTSLLPRIDRLGGSAAQREVVEETLLAALLQSGQDAAASQLLQHRLDRRPHPNDARRLAGLQSLGAPTMPE